MEYKDRIRCETLAERQEATRRESLEKKHISERKIENAKKLAEEMIKQQRDQFEIRDKIAQQRMASFEKQKSEERQQVIERAI